MEYADRWNKVLKLLIKDLKTVDSIDNIAISLGQYENELTGKNKIVIEYTKIPKKSPYTIVRVK